MSRKVDGLRTIAVLNQKGGVGKTTTAVNVAAALAAAGRKVVVIDLDPQAHLTIHLGVEPQTSQAGAYEVLTQSADFAQSLMLVRPNLWLLAANINLVGAETELISVVGREIILREAMQACQDQFDFCLIDCPPSLSVLSLNALAAAQEVLIPLQPHFLALQGFGKLLQTVDLVNKRINRASQSHRRAAVHERHAGLPVQRGPRRYRAVPHQRPGHATAPGPRPRSCRPSSAATSSWPRPPATARRSSSTTPTATAPRTTPRSPSSSSASKTSPRKRLRPSRSFPPRCRSRHPLPQPPIEIREVSLPVPQPDTPVPVCTKQPAPAGLHAL